MHVTGNLNSPETHELLRSQLRAKCALGGHATCRDDAVGHATWIALYTHVCEDQTEIALVPTLEPLVLSVFRFPVVVCSLSK